MDEELIETIAYLVVEKFRIQTKAKSEGWTDSMQRYYRQIVSEMARLRSVAILYREWSSIQNLALLGEKYIRDLKRDLPPMVFLTSVMSKRITKLLGGFYSNLSEKHYYSDFNNSYLDNCGYDFDKLQDESCLQDGDLDFDPADLYRIRLQRQYQLDSMWSGCFPADAYPELLFRKI